jgi:hypothetical protein
MTPDRLLLFGQEDLVFFLIVILFMVIGGLTQLFKKLQEAQRAPRRPRPGPRPGGVRPGGGARANVPPGRDPVRAEIDQFLRRAADRRGAGPQPAQRVGPPPAGRPAPQPWAQRPAQAPGGVEPVEVVPEPDSVADHVRHQLPQQQAAAWSSEVGRHWQQAGDSMETHVHEAFDHQVSGLEATPGESAYAAEPDELDTPEDRVTAIPQTAAAGLAAMLAEPTNLRQAIVLTEILQRPEHRWS